MAKRLTQSEKKGLVKLSKAKKFHVTLIAMLMDDLEKEKIITPMQKSQIKEYTGKKLL